MSRIDSSLDACRSIENMSKEPTDPRREARLAHESGNIPDTELALFRSILDCRGTDEGGLSAYADLLIENGGDDAQVGEFIRCQLALAGVECPTGRCVESRKHHNWFGAPDRYFCLCQGEGSDLFEKSFRLLVDILGNGQFWKLAIPTIVQDGPIVADLRSSAIPACWYSSRTQVSKCFVYDVGCGNAHELPPGNRVAITFFRGLPYVATGSFGAIFLHAKNLAKHSTLQKIRVTGFEPFDLYRLGLSPEKGTRCAIIPMLDTGSSPVASVTYYVGEQFDLSFITDSLIREELSQCRVRVTRYAQSANDEHRISLDVPHDSRLFEFVNLRKEQWAKNQYPILTEYLDVLSVFLSRYSGVTAGYGTHEITCNDSVSFLNFDRLQVFDTFEKCYQAVSDEFLRDFQKIREGKAT